MCDRSVFSSGEIRLIVGCLAKGVTPECMVAAFEMTYLNIGRYVVRYAEKVALNLLNNNCYTKEEAWRYYKAFPKANNLSTQGPVEKQYMYVVKVRNMAGEWYTNALIENSFDTIQVAKLYRDQLGYDVQIWHKGKDVSFLMNGQNIEIPGRLEGVSDGQQ